MIKGIVCVAANWAIGKNNDLLFNIKADMQHFKEKTMNKTVVMGYNTLLSFPGSKPLKNRTNIVLCPEGIERDDCICYHDFDELVKDLLVKSKTEEIWVIGGGMFYKSMLPYYDEVEVTKVNSVDSEATVFFPNLDTNPDFKVASFSQRFYENNHEYIFVTYKRK